MSRTDDRLRVSQVSSASSSRGIEDRQSGRASEPVTTAARIWNTLAPASRQTLGPVVTGRDMFHLSAAMDAEFSIAGGEGAVQVMVAGAVPGEGCTITALGIALVAAAQDDGRRVLLIDASDGAAGRALGVAADQPGLSDLMSGGITRSLDDLWSPTKLPNLWLLTRGCDGVGRRTLSGTLERLLGAARGGFDLVVIDAPALLDDPAALVLAREAGRVLLVARRAGLPAADLSAAVEEVRRTGATLVGCVLTNPRRRNRRGASA